MNDNNIVYFDSFGVEQILKEIKILIKKKNIITNIFRIQVYNWIIHGHFRVGFFYFMLKVKILLDYTNLVFSIICRKCKNVDEKIFKEEELIEILKILGLVENM